MTVRLLIATTNPNKLREIRALMSAPHKGGPYERVVDAGPCERVVDARPYERVVDARPCERVVDARPCERVVDAGPYGRVVDAGPYERVVDAGAYELVTLGDFPPIAEPEETGATFWENARIKALAYAAATGLTTIAEDSGFEIDALGGEPGVRSARFLRPDATYPERFAEIYRRLAGQPSTARFVTALAVARGHEVLFETETSIEGTVAESPRGQHGFGYDPIFWYPPFGRTTAELTEQEKAVVSHRARAFRDLLGFLRSRSLRPDP